MPDPGFEIETVRPERTEAFWSAHERDYLSDLHAFRVVWHEQRHELLATRGDAILGALRLRIAASLAHLEALYVLPAERRRGVGAALLERARELAIYYNCHKITLTVPHESEAQRFFLACGYALEAVLPQHVFKLDAAVLRKFLL